MIDVDAVGEGFIEDSITPGIAPTSVGYVAFEMIAKESSVWGDYLVRLVKTPDGKIFRVGPGMGG